MKKWILKYADFFYKKTINIFSFIIALPIASVLFLIFPVFKIKLVRLCNNRIGHYALNTELLLCYLDQLKKQEVRTIYLFYLLQEPICNEQLHRMWKRIIPITSFATTASYVNRILMKILKDKYKNEALRKFETAHGAVDQFGFLKKFKPHLSFTKNEVQRAKNELSQLGITADSKFVCLIVRDSAYLKREYPGNDWRYHDHRNADITNYQEVALYLAKKGYYVLRMGKFVEKEFNVMHEKIIDYANCSLRSDFLDIYLSANCEFCISTTTGLDCVSQVFRRPVLLTNVSPVFTETLMWYPCTLFIPKLLRNRLTGKFLTQSETAAVCYLVSSQVLEEFDRKHLDLIENTGEQLLEVVKEMELLLVNNEHINEQQKLMQSLYWNNYEKYCPIPVDKVYIKLGSKFLESNSMLLH